MKTPIFIKADIEGGEEKFLKGAIRRGYSRNTTEQVWDMIKSFSGYSFCKPHSASYAMLSFTCAYLKAHFPAEFMSSVISNKGGFYSTYAYMSEARRLGIKISQPDINMSYKKWIMITSKYEFHRYLHDILHFLY